MPRKYPVGVLIETFPIEATGPAGHRLVVRVYQGRERDSARLVRVYDGSACLYDVESYDIANATDRLDWWLAAQPFVPVPAVYADLFDRGEFTPRLTTAGTPDSVLGVYYLRWKAERDAAEAAAQGERCDACGQPAGDDGQKTAESVLCGACVAPAARRASAETLTHDLGGEG